MAGPETGPNPIDDLDLDGVADGIDNCPSQPNPDHADADADGTGDACEPTADVDGDGLPFGIDDDDGNARRLPGGTDRDDGVYVQSGNPLRLGAVALSAAAARDFTAGGVQLTAAEFALGAADAYAGVGPAADDLDSGASGTFDVAVLDAADSAGLVMALGTGAPQGAVLQVCAPGNGTWSEFLSSGADRLASARSANGNCPVTESGNYLAGLSSGLDCVRVEVSDGGPNDADGTANGEIAVIVRTVVAARDGVPGTNPGTVASSGGGSGGGGSLGAGLLALLCGLRSWRRGMC